MHEGNEVGVEVETDGNVGCVRSADESRLEFVQIDDPKGIVWTLVTMVDSFVVERYVDRCAGENDGATDVGNR